MTRKQKLRRMLAAATAAGVLVVSGMGTSADAAKKQETYSTKLSKVSWKIEQPSSSSDKERDAAALKALEERAEELVAEWNRAPVGPDYVIVSVQRTKTNTTRTETKKNPWTGTRKHKAVGQAYGVLLVRVK